jgi:hypothetical protein
MGAGASAGKASWSSDSDGSSSDEDGGAGKIVTTKTKLKFQRASCGAQLPADWRLATHEEVQANLGQIRKMLGHWDICKLANNWKVDGPGYGCTVRRQDRGEDMGHAIFVKAPKSDEVAVMRRVKGNIQTLYHVTEENNARSIAQGGFMLRGSERCMFGSGVYFAATEEQARQKAWHGHTNPCVIIAQVDLGRCYEIQTPDNSLTFTKLQKIGYDSVWARPQPLGPMKFHQEWVVYNKDQVHLLSVKVHGAEILPS